MNAFFRYLTIQFKMDLRDRGFLLSFYMMPLIFFAVMGAVFSSINPQMKTTLAATMTIFAATMGAVMGSPTPLVHLRESGTLRAFRVNGIPTSAVLSVHSVSTFLHLFLVSCVIYVLSPVLFHSQVPQSPPLYFAAAAAFLFASVGVGMLIGSCARGQSQATVISMLVFMPSILFSGIMFPSSMLPEPFLWLGRIIPATYALQSFYGLAYRMQTDLDGLLSLAAVLGFGILTFLLAAWRFRQIGETEQI
ncbi:ABC transporter permease [Caproicibacter sp.]|uniref:ABC transporter permease n=1 Tax=Caproicibacter sp. TaxID=2814884 RepID=UPI0039892450